MPYNLSVCHSYIFTIFTISGGLLECLVAVPEDVAGLLVDPAGGAGAPEPGGGELPAVAALAVDLPVVAQGEWQ